jgi:hypothetical protein
LSPSDPSHTLLVDGLDQEVLARGDRVVVARGGENQFACPAREDYSRGRLAVEEAGCGPRGNKWAGWQGQPVVEGEDAIKGPLSPPS